MTEVREVCIPYLSRPNSKEKTAVFVFFLSRKSAFYVDKKHTKAAVFVFFSNAAFESYAWGVSFRIVPFISKF